MLSGMKKGKTTGMYGIQWRCGGVGEKKGLTCYEYDAECVRAGEYNIINEVESYCECTNL